MYRVIKIIGIHYDRPIYTDTRACPQNTYTPSVRCDGRRQNFFFFRGRTLAISSCLSFIFLTCPTKTADKKYLLCDHRVIIIIIKKNEQWSYTLPFASVDSQRELIVSGKLDGGYGFGFATLPSGRRPFVSDHHWKLVADHRFLHGLSCFCTKQKTVLLPSNIRYTSL